MLYESSMVRRNLAAVLLLALFTCAARAVAQTPPVTLDVVRTRGAPWFLPLFRPVLTRALIRYATCATATWRTTPTVAGTLTVEFGVGGPSGVPFFVRTRENGLSPSAPGLVSCVLSTTRRLHVPNDIEGGVANVRFTLRFTPSLSAPTSARGSCHPRLLAKEHESGDEQRPMNSGTSAATIRQLATNGRPQAVGVRAHSR